MSRCVSVCQTDNVYLLSFLDDEDNKNGIEISIGQYTYYTMKKKVLWFDILQFRDLLYKIKT